MENILEIKNLEDYDYNNIKLSTPFVQNGNNYYINITIGDKDKPLYIQLPKCSTKAGYVKNNTRAYTDIIFSASDNHIIKWLENFEIYLQNQIYKKKDIWFDSDINLDDIQELMTPITRSYRSGKNMLIRCNIKNHKCSVYDENEILLNLEKFTDDKEIIPLISINGIKFSSKNFTIELNLTQIMILSKKEDLEKECLIRSSSIKKSKNINKENNLDSNIHLNKNNTLEIKSNNQDNQDNQDNILLNIDTDSLEKKELININDNDLDNNVDLDNINKISEKNKNIDINSTTKMDKMNKMNKMNKMDEIDLETLDNIGNNNNLSNINIKQPMEIYYDIYKNALIKANELKRNTIEAFLTAKNIKLKYNLADLDLDSNIGLNLDLEDNIDNIDKY